MVHVALVPDGFRRWAVKKGYTYFDAYLQGVHKLSDYLKILFNHEDIDVDIVSIYLSSLENMARSKEDVHAFCQAEYILCNDVLPLIAEEYSVNFILAGCIDALPPTLQKASYRLAAIGNGENARKVYLALAYDPEVEVEVSFSGQQPLGTLLDSLWIKEYVDIFIRTGQGTRASKFLPLQCAGHAKTYHLDKLFLETDQHDIATILESYILDESRGLVETVEDMIGSDEIEL
jgi:undecaprenyl diphosphate synthase